jgi:hypothetical protein
MRITGKWKNIISIGLAVLVLFGGRTPQGVRGLK